MIRESKTIGRRYPVQIIGTIWTEKTYRPAQCNGLNVWKRIFVSCPRRVTHRNDQFNYIRSTQISQKLDIFFFYRFLKVVDGRESKRITEWTPDSYSLISLIPTWHNLIVHIILLYCLFLWWASLPLKNH